MKDSGRKKIVMAVVGIFYALCLYASINLDLDDRITSMLPDDDPYVSDFKYIINNIPATEIVYFDIQNKGADAETLGRAADYFYQAIKDAPYFSDILYRISNEKFVNLVNLVDRKKTVLLDEKDLKTFEDKLTPDNIQKAVVEIKRKLLSPAGFFMAKSLTRDPLGMTGQILSKLNSFQNDMAVQFEGGKIYSRDGRHLLIIANPSFPAVNTQKTSEMVGFLNEIKGQVREKFAGTVYVGVSGNHVATLDNSITIQNDVKRALLVLSIGIFFIGFLFFSRRLFIFLIFVPTLVSLTFATAVMSLAHSRVSAIALGCGAVLVGITVDFGIHILFAADQIRNRSIDDIIAGLKKPIAAGACTTMAAFSCLLLSTLPGQRQTGLFAVIGVGMAALFAVFLLKYFIPEDTGRQRPPLISLVNFCNHFMAFRKKHLRLVCCCGGVLFAVSLVGLKDFKFEGDVSRLNHLSPVAARDTASFLETWGAFSPSVVLVSADTLERALVKNDRLFDLLEKMKKTGQIIQIDSISNIFPSAGKRKENFKAFQAAIPPDRTAEIEKNFVKAARDNGFKAAVFQPFLNDLKRIRHQSAPETLTLNDFKDTAIAQLLNEKIVFQEKKALILTTLTVADKADIQTVAKRVKTGIDGAMFLNKRDFVEKITTYVAREFQQLLFFAAFSMVAIVFIFFRKIKIVFIAVLPVFLSALMTAGILGLAHIEINLISTIFVVFVFGIGIDFSIFLTNFELHHKMQKDQVTAGAVILCAMSTSGAFACLIFANHNALFSIGAAGLTGMLTCLLSALVLVPTLTEKFFPEKKR